MEQKQAELLLNVALHLKNFGFEVKFAGRIGTDQLGYDLKSFIEKQGLDSGLLQIDNELQTSTVKVHLEPITSGQVRYCGQCCLGQD